ncbi:unnamed protein product [Caenorhabditis brenneri]
MTVDINGKTRFDADIGTIEYKAQVTAIRKKNKLIWRLIGNLALEELNQYPFDGSLWSKLKDYKNVVKAHSTRQKLINANCRATSSNGLFIIEADKWFK